MVSIAGGEPLVHKEMPAMVEQITRLKKFVYLCTNAILLPKKIQDCRPSPYLTFSIHLDGNRQRHDTSVCQAGVYDKAVAAIELARAQGFRVTINYTLFQGEEAEEIAEFLDRVTAMSVEGITMSPGFSYEHAPRQDMFLSRQRSKRLFRDLFSLGKLRQNKWPFNHSPLYLDFLAGNQRYQCTPWSNPTYNIFGWQRPCYLLVDEGYASCFQELMDDTAWENYGFGRNQKCQNCMAHCGYEGTAVDDTFSRPLKALRLGIRGPRTFCKTRTISGEFLLLSPSAGPEKPMVSYGGRKHRPPWIMASINKNAVRDELDRLRSQFDDLSSGGSLTRENKMLMQSILTLLELICAIFLEKNTTMTSKNSSKPSSQTDKDESSLRQKGRNGKGKKLRIDKRIGAHEREGETDCEALRYSLTLVLI